MASHAAAVALRSRLSSVARRAQLRAGGARKRKEPEKQRALAKRRERQGSSVGAGSAARACTLTRRAMGAVPHCDVATRRGAVRLIYGREVRKTV